jgi:hypothetical protein
MLGARRNHVLERAHRVEEDGILRYAKGRITPLNRQQLEQRSCECYTVIKNEYGRLLPRLLAM